MSIQDQDKRALRVWKNTLMNMANESGDHEEFLRSFCLPLLAQYQDMLDPNDPMHKYINLYKEGKF